MPRGIPVRKSLQWITPRDCEPGQVVLVHALWTPNPEHHQRWMEIPDPPGDEIMGYWSPVPRPYLAVQDAHFAHCCLMAPGLVNLFQEDEDFCTILTLDKEWRFPWDGEYFLAVMTPQLQKEVDELNAAPETQ